MKEYRFPYGNLILRSLTFSRIESKILCLIFFLSRIPSILIKIYLPFKIYSEYIICTLIFITYNLNFLIRITKRNINY